MKRIVTIETTQFIVGAYPHRRKIDTATIHEDDEGVMNTSIVQTNYHTLSMDLT